MKIPLIPIIRRLAALLTWFAGGLGPPVLAQPAPPAEVLLRAGEGRYHTYRIPASVVVRNGVVVLLLEGRKDAQDDFAAINLLCLRSLDGGQTWKIGASTQLSPELDTPESRFSGKWIPGESTWHGCEGMAEELPDGRLSGEWLGGHRPTN